MVDSTVYTALDHSQAMARDPFVGHGPIFMGTKFFPFFKYLFLNHFNTTTHLRNAPKNTPVDFGWGFECIWLPIRNHVGNLL